MRRARWTKALAIIAAPLVYSGPGCVELFYAPPPFAGSSFDVTPETQNPRKRQDTVRRDMWRMAQFVRALGEGLSTDGSPQRERLIVGALAGLETQATTLLNGPAVLEHPILSEKLPRYVAEVSEAKVAAERVPPDYVPAETLLGACARCHELRMEPR